MSLNSKCPLCSSKNIFLFLERLNFPVHQNFLFESQYEAVNAVRGDLKFVCCKDCGFVFNSAFDQQKLTYNSSYENDQTHSQCFQNYINGILDYLVESRGVKNCTVLEIGCGKGYFLRKLVERGNIGFGFDPAYTGPEVDLDGKMIIYKTVYDQRFSDIDFDVLICRHVIEHIPDPLSFMLGLRKSLRNRNKQVRLFFETPCVEWILRNQVIWDFFYEHCSLFSVNSIRTLFELSGFSIDLVRHQFGDQYLWVEASFSYQDFVVPIKNSGNIPDLAQKFGVVERQLRERWYSLIKDMKGRGENIAVWGAGAKGVTFVNLVDPSRETISCVIDINPSKQGRYVAGTGHLIIDYREAPSLGITSAIVMNPNYMGEIQETIRKEGISLKLIST